MTQAGSINTVTFQDDPAQAIAFYQEQIAIQPDVRGHYWHLGLAYLLQGEETEAQTTWMLALMAGDDAQVQQWTSELVAILHREADRQTASNPAIAWAIRQHIREIDPTDLINILQLIELSIGLKTFQPSDLIDLGAIELLRSGGVAAIESDLRLRVLKSLLSEAPSDEAVLEFATICLEQAAEPIALALALMDTAIWVAYELNQPLLGVRYIDLCLQIYPENLNLLSHLSYFYQNANQHDRAIAIAQRYCTLARSLPDQIFGAFIMMRALMREGNAWDHIQRIFEHQETLISALTTDASELGAIDQMTVFQLSTSTFCQPYLRDSLAQNRQTQNRLMQVCHTSIHAYAQERADRYHQGLTARRQTRDATKRLRIGYVSHCLKRHSVGWLCRGLFDHHDRDQFEIYGFFWNAQSGVQDEVQHWFVQRVHQARFLARNSGEIAEQIFADEIDILIDLDSITADILCEVLALKPAPIQATWLGWDASGIPAIDYFIADHYVLPETADAHYAEKIWRLPQTYIAVDGFEIGVPSLRRDQLQIPADAIVYWSGQTSYKRHPVSVQAQLKILSTVPNSYLLIKGLTDAASIQRYFTEQAIAVNVDPARLRFLPDVALESVHRANLGIADVVLDTYPYNGATTTLETLWMGIPLVTRVGDHFSSRNSYGMMINAGITEGIAWSEAEYIDWGIRFGTEPTLRQQVAWKLRQARQTAPLWNAQQFTRHMEAAYEQMWQIYTNQDR